MINPLRLIEFTPFPDTESKGKPVILRTNTEDATAEIQAKVANGLVTIGTSRVIWAERPEFWQKHFLAAFSIGFALGIVATLAMILTIQGLF